MYIVDTEDLTLTLKIATLQGGWSGRTKVRQNGKITLSFTAVFIGSKCKIT